MIYDKTGKRKYLTVKERQAFISVAQKFPATVSTFCLMLACTGARISEVLAVTPERIDIEAGFVVIESLKKRRRGMYRAIPVPHALLRRLEVTHDVAAAQLDMKLRTSSIWPWSRTTAWTLVKRVMLEAGVAPDRAMPKALRHAFGVCAIQRGVPLNIVQKWLGHARISTTAIYADAVGAEERMLLKRMWSGHYIWMP